MKIFIIMIFFAGFILAKSQLQEVIDKTPAYSKIELPNGVFQAPIFINKPLILKGSKYTVIQGNTKGTLLHIKGSNITIENITFKKSGNQRYSLDSAIRIDGSSKIRVKNCKFQEVLFGVIFYDSFDSVIDNSTFKSYKEPIADNRGDSVRLWNCKNITIKDNNISNSRDISINRSQNITIKNNYEKNGRYGILINMSKNVNVERNKILSNYVGIMCEGSSDINITKNNIIKSHLSTGTGIMLSGGKNIHITLNKIKSHAQAIYVSTTLAELGMRRYIEFNDISNNNTAFHFYQTIKNNTIKNNNITNNLDDVVKDVRGGKYFENDIKLNFWDKNKGFDRNEDGISDTPYLVMIYADKLWQFNHKLKLFYGTPLLSIVDFIEKLAPFSEPVLLMKDTSPMITPISLDAGTL